MSEESSTTRPFEELATTGDARMDGIARLLAIVDRLRADDGCPWDLKQTVRSMASSLTEEAFEAVEAIDQGDVDGTVEELGDLVMVVALIARIAEQDASFDMGRIVTVVGDKLIRRHPHVFGEANIEGSEAVVANWERIKREERAEKETDTSALAGVPVALPALQRADRLGAKAIAAGFRWSDAKGAHAKLTEEIGELTAELEADEIDMERVESELGDVLLAGALLGRYLKIDPERATRAATRRFEARFRHMESTVGGPLAEQSLPELIEAWGRAKDAASQQS